MSRAASQFDNNAYQDAVAGQYKKWVYPKPIDDIRLWKQSGKILGSDPNTFHYNYWPKQPYQADINILSAGCGANEAAIIAYENPNAHVVGIDISHESLRHQQYLKKKHNLRNLVLKKLALEEVGSLNQRFDYICSSGVLHHLKVPEVGLKELSNCLTAEGVFSIMLYAKIGRAGVYMLQELFELLNIGQSEHDVEMVKELIQTLPGNHPIDYYRTNVTDMHYGAGLVDSFLHTRDVAYTVDELCDFAGSANMKLQTWKIRGAYDPLRYYDMNDPCYQALMKLPEQLRWSVMEKLDGNMIKHSFALCHQNKSEQLYEIDFDKIDIFSVVPQKITVNQTVYEIDNKKLVEITTLSRKVIKLNDIEAKLFAQFDRNKSLGDCCAVVGLNMNDSDVRHFVKIFVEYLWRNSAVLIGVHGA